MNQKEFENKIIIDGVKGYTLSCSVSKMGFLGKWDGDEIKDPKQVLLPDNTCLTGAGLSQAGLWYVGP